MFDFEKFQERIAIVDDEQEFTYRELMNFSIQLTNKILCQQLVILLCDNSYTSTAIYVGLLNKNATVIMLSANQKENYIIKILKHYNVKFIFAPMNKTLSIDKENIGIFNHYCLYKFKSNRIPINHKLILMLPTSGSTGSAKFVRLSKENLIINAEAIIKYQKLTKEDAAITTLPMSYAYGLSIINTHLMVGGKIVFTKENILSRRFWTVLKQRGVTNFGGVPFTYEILNRLNFSSLIEGSSLRFMSQAGGALSVDLIHAHYVTCKKHNIKFIVMYGQTEATARISYVPWENLPDKIGSIGIPIPEGKMDLINDKNKIIYSPQVVGEIRYKGKNVMLGYASKVSDLNKGNENNFVLMTGDLAYKDEDGYYYIVGRKKRIIKIFGIRISLDDIEVMLHEKGATCLCKALDNKLYIYFINTKHFNKYIKYISKEIEIPSSCIKATFIKSFPRTESGKIDYKKLP